MFIIGKQPISSLFRLGNKFPNHNFSNVDLQLDSFVFDISSDNFENCM